MSVRHKQSRGHRSNKKPAGNRIDAEKKPEKIEKVSIKNWLSSINIKDSLTADNVFAWLFVFSLGTVAFEIRPLQKTVGALDLYFKSAAFGILFGFVLIWYFHRAKYRTTAYGKTVYRKPAPHGLVIVAVCFFLTPPLASLTNRKLSVLPPYKQQYVVLRKLAKESRGSSYYQLAILPKNSQNNEIQIITMRKEIWDSFSERETVTCTMHSGLWGFPVIDQIERD